VTPVREMALATGWDMELGTECGRMVGMSFEL
jgi:hypothetical protein